MRAAVIWENRERTMRVAERRVLTCALLLAACWAGLPYLPVLLWAVH